MLGEAAKTHADAERYRLAYRDAIGAIGRSAAGRGPIAGPGISVKLSALHPRYEPLQAARCVPALIGTLIDLALAAKAADIGLTVDAEEADRLEISLDIFAAVLGDPRLAGWDGLGLAVQGYQKRALPLIDWVAALGRRTRHRIPTRLVKGAYWDSEIKLAQVQGHADYPVFTRKAATDVSWLACARRMLECRDAIYPAFATHNAHSLAFVLECAGDGRVRDAAPARHGRGAVPRCDVSGARLCAGRHARGSARLSGAPAAGERRQHQLRASPGRSVRAGRCDRRRSRGAAARARRQPQSTHRSAARSLSGSRQFRRRRSRRPRHRACVACSDSPPCRTRLPSSAAHGKSAVRPIAACWSARSTMLVLRRSTRELDVLARGWREWDTAGGAHRAAVLERAADLIEASREELLFLLAREGGKTLADGIAEIREAADHCRWYALHARKDFAAPRELAGPTGERNTWALGGRGVFAAISPWNFPLAIFTGQVAAALAAGNAVAAKPAEQTPLVAARAVALLLEAGVPRSALALLPGDGTVGQALVSDPRIAGVAFTGGTDTAQTIARSLAARPGPIIPFIAETGGINAMIVDSSALAEQVVTDVLTSAFGSAGQRCSALRLLCLQDDIADRVLRMLHGAAETLTIGDPLDPATDVGPVIDEDARATLERAAARFGTPLFAVPLPPGTEHGSFFAPRAFLLRQASELRTEIFGPVLCIVRYAADRLDEVMDAIDATGYGLTLGIHSRIEATQRRITERLRIGNTYVNRNQIGAVVGVQPFGGRGLSGTGPKAGGPITLYRFAEERVVSVNTAAAGGNAALLALDES